MNAMFAVKRKTTNPTSVPMVPGVVDVESMLLETELSSCEAQRIDGVLYAITCRGSRAKHLLGKIVPYLNPQRTLERYQAERKEPVDVTGDRMLHALALRITHAAAMTLLTLGVEPDRIALSLMSWATSGPRGLRSAACWAITALGARGRIVVPQLIALMQEAEMRLDAIRTIQWIGEAATAAVPALDQLVRKGTEEEREVALDALLSIGIIPRQCFPHVVHRLQRPGLEGQVWSTLFYSTASKSVDEFVFVTTQLLVAWPDVPELGRRRVTDILLEFAEKFRSLKEYQEQGRRCSSQIALFLLAEANAEIQQKLIAAKSLFDECAP